MPFLPLNQQRQSTECSCFKYISAQSRKLTRIKSASSLLHIPNLEATNSSPSTYSDYSNSIKAIKITCTLSSSISKQHSHKIEKIIKINTARVSLTVSASLVECETEIFELKGDDAV